MKTPTLLAVLLLCVTPTLASAQLRDRIRAPGKGDEIEGTLWIYKATIDSKNKSMSGKIRMDDNAIYEVSEKGALARRIAEKEKRIGDVLTERGDKQKQLVFNESDHIKGRAFVEYDAKLKMYKGYFNDDDKQRWKFELRRGED
jgi:hypothetical protein